VQSFTPILGTLLLSPNGLVGGPARFAVVELLNRVRRANEIERRLSDRNEQGTAYGGDGVTQDRMAAELQQSVGLTSITPPTPSVQNEDDYLPIGLLGSEQRRLFEREMIQQVVIGMGRLDLPEEAAAYYAEADNEEVGSALDVPTPLAQSTAYPLASERMSYFPPYSTIQNVVLPDNNPVPSSPIQRLEQSNPQLFASSPPASDTTSPSSLPGLSTDSPTARPSSSSSHGPVTPPSTALTASETSDHARGRKSSPLLTPTLLEREHIHTPEQWNAAHIGRPISPSPMSPRFLSPASHVMRPPSPRPLRPRPPSPRPHSPPETPTHLPMQSHGPDLAPIPVDVHLPSIPVSPTPHHALELPQSSMRDDAAVDMPQHEMQALEVADEAQLSEEASVGRLSSMSLMAAVTASGGSYFVLTGIPIWGICSGGVPMLHIAAPLVPCVSIALCPKPN
jgi:serine/threonine-protein phosphatase 4 regulatory subunit 1